MSDITDVLDPTMHQAEVISYSWLLAGLFSRTCQPGFVNSLRGTCFREQSHKGLFSRSLFYGRFREQSSRRACYSSML